MNARLYRLFVPFESWLGVLCFAAVLAQGPVRAATPEVTFQMSVHTNQPGDTVLASVSVSSFSQVTSAQFSLEWDPRVIRFISTAGYGLSGLGDGNFGTNGVGNGILTFAWDDPTTAGVTEPDGTIIFSVSYLAIGGVGTTSALWFCDSPTSREVAVNLDVVTFHSVNGRVQIESVSRPVFVPGALGVLSNGVFHCKLAGVAGASYEMKASSDLTNWSILPSLLMTNSISDFFDRDTNNVRRFYRARLLP